MDTSSKTQAETKMEEFPIGSRVILQDLTTTAFNGRVGVIKSKLHQNGRQQVSLLKNGKEGNENDENKILGLKPINLKLEPRPVDSLSTREMKTVLSRKNYTNPLAGYDKSELRSLVEAHVSCPNEIASILAKAQAAVEPTPTPDSNSAGSTASNTRQQMREQAAQLNQLSPEQLRQQAQMMRSMDPSMIRRMNPAMANLTDAQIQMAAAQMEAMANNPQMVEGVVNQINNMDDSQMENLSRMQEFAGTNTNANATSDETVAGAPAMSANGMQSMANMSPEQLLKQAAMMKSVPKDTLRKMNPLMASWPDSQIDMAISQMESMAKNPEMSKRMMDQMKNMKPEEIEKLQKLAQNGSFANLNASGASGDGNTAGIDPNAMAKDPMAMLKNTDPAQIKQMLQMVKENPALFKDMIRGANPGMADQLSDEQISKTMESFANMDESKIGWIMKGLGLMQKIRDVMQLKGVVLLLKVLFISIVLFFYMRYTEGKAENDDTSNLFKENEDVISMTIPEVEDDEF